MCLVHRLRGSEVCDAHCFQRASFLRFISTHIRFRVGFCCVRGVVVISCLFPSGKLCPCCPRFGWQSKARADTADFLWCSDRAIVKDSRVIWRAHGRVAEVHCSVLWFLSSLKAKACVCKLFCISRFQPRGDGNVNNVGQDGMESPSEKVDRQHY